jgi:hypothetical protein
MISYKGEIHCEVSWVHPHNWLPMDGMLVAVGLLWLDSIEMDDIREEKPHFTDVKYDFFT